MGWVWLSQKHAPRPVTNDHPAAMTERSRQAPVTTSKRKTDSLMGRRWGGKRTPCYRDFWHLLSSDDAPDILSARPAYTTDIKRFCTDAQILSIVSGRKVKFLKICGQKPYQPNSLHRRRLTHPGAGCSPGPVPWYSSEIGKRGFLRGCAGVVPGRRKVCPERLAEREGFEPSIRF